jgi:hypothetical protein
MAPVVMKERGSKSALGQKQTSGSETAMSALPPKADIAGRRLDVRFVPKADIGFGHSITSSARNNIDGGTVRLSAFAVWVFIARSNFTGT